jgi:tRNA G18 (ribose-2'-O)-methylase SpoU
MKVNSKTNPSAHGLSLLLLDIRSVQNVASLFRTADCAGVSKLYLVGTTPSPLDRFNRPRADFSKISLGAEKTVSYEYHADVETLLKRFHGEGRKIVALEQSEDSVDYKDYQMEGDTVLVLGNEVSGVDQSVLDRCDATIEIPMLGAKESLNVSIAGAVAIFRLLNI